jgi:hypothetical protein
MKTVIITVTVYTVILVSLLAITPAPPEGRYYDCSLAEFHPDFPQEVKEACRKLRIKTPTTPGLTT